MKKLNFKSRINIGFAAVFIIMFFTVFYAIWQLNKFSDKMELVYEHPFKVSNAIREVQVEIFKAARQVRGIMFTDNKDQIDSIIKSAEESDSMVGEALNLINIKYLGNKKDVDSIINDYTDVKKIRTKLFRLKSENKNDSLVLIFKTESQNKINEIISHTNTISNFAANKAKVSVEEASEYKQITKTVLIFTIIIAS